MNPRHHSNAYSLIEMLVYISILFVVFALGYSALYHSRQNSIDLKRNADDITRTLDAGERWRADIRASTASPRVMSDGNELRLTTASGEIVYQFENRAIWRTQGGNKSTVLKGVRTSCMLGDARKHITSWRWEIELLGSRSVVHTKPLFTFQAVPGTKE